MSRGTFIPPLTASASVASAGEVELGNRETQPEPSLMSRGTFIPPLTASASVASAGEVELGNS